MTDHTSALARSFAEGLHQWGGGKQDQVRSADHHGDGSHDEKSHGGGGSTGGKSKYRENAGYAGEAPNRQGGTIVVYKASEQGLGKGWAVMHEPSGNHIVVPQKSQAMEIMRGIAKSKTHDEAAGWADILPHEDDE